MQLKVIFHNAFLSLRVEILQVRIGCGMEFVGFGLGCGSLKIMFAGSCRFADFFFVGFGWGYGLT